MDKGQTQRGGGGSSQFSPVKRQTEKSKKEKLKRLSSVGRMSLSNEMDELLLSTSSTTKGLALPKKYFDDCNPVDHASVPRKLRSAMKKRGCDAVSPSMPNSRKLSHALELKDRAKKLKLNKPRDLEMSFEEASVGPITKDEEEVAETLYALARMFPENDKAGETRLNGEISEEKSVALPGVNEEEDPKTICQTPCTEAANRVPTLEDSSGENMEVQTSNEATKCDLPNSEQYPVDLWNYCPQVDLSTMPPLFSNAESMGERSAQNSMVSIYPSELCLGTGFKHDKTPTSRQNLEITRGQVTPFRSQDTTTSECKNNGLSSTESHGAEMGGSLPMSSAKLPAWLCNATHARQTCSSEKVCFTKKDSRAVADRKKSWKKCTAHVYISRLIKVLQMTEKKETLPVEPAQRQLNEESVNRAFIADRNLHVWKNDSAEKNSKEVRNAILLHKRLLQDQQQACTTSELCTSHKQTFDVSSLSAGGGCGVEASNLARGSVNRLEPSTQFHVPYAHSPTQRHTIMRLSNAQNCSSSASSTDHLSVGAARQLPIEVPPYFGSQLSGPSHLATALLHNQQQMWATQFTPPRYSPGEFAAPRLQNWQNGRRTPPTLAQPMLQPFGSSPEMLGPKYVPGSILEVLEAKYTQQQQQFIPMTSLMPPKKMKRQFHRFPSGYEENGGLFHLDNASPQELLCNEQL